MSELIQVGDKVKDKITGFTGIATSMAVYLNGCVQFCVAPPIDSNGKSADREYIDHEYLEIIEKQVVKLVPTPYNSSIPVKKAKPTGGDPTHKPPTRYKG